MIRANKNFDVIVIGAGPAGSLAATLLAQEGFSVALMEKQKFPRNKVCGECLSALGYEVLKRCELAGAVDGWAIPLGRTILHALDASSIAIPLPAPMWGISRQMLDSRLLSAARDAGVEVFQPCMAQAIIAGPIPSIRVGHDLWQARLVVNATGGARISGTQRASLTGSLGMKCHLTNLDGPRDAIELFGLNGHYVGLAPIENDGWNLAMSIPGARVKEMGCNYTQILAGMKSDNPALAKRLSGVTSVSLFGCLLPRFGVAAEWDKNVIPLGNAAAAVEPIGGEGMGLAMASAELAAREIIAAFREGRAVDMGGLRCEFKRLWNARRFGCRLGGMALSSPWMAAVAVRFLNDFPNVGAKVAMLVGK